jgi:hypothetical protein
LRSVPKIDVFERRLDSFPTRAVLDSKISDHGATTLAGARKGGEIDAQVIEMEQSLRDAGLLTGPPASGHYRQWLENAVRRGVPIDTIKKIAAEHHITPEDFKILDGMDEFREDEDGDGTFKSYFLMPTNISGDDAAKAVRMTYILNAGTDYGTEGETTDFKPTPYGSEELRRITDRQRENSWSYDDDVGFVHGNGGRLATTPNGMMMGLGGNLIQDQFSQRGGTTWGDTFMLNIDNPKDPAQHGHAGWPYPHRRPADSAPAPRARRVRLHRHGDRAARRRGGAQRHRIVLRSARLRNVRRNPVRGGPDTGRAGAVAAVPINATTRQLTSYATLAANPQP